MKLEGRLILVSVTALSLLTCVSGRRLRQLTAQNPNSESVWEGDAFFTRILRGSDAESGDQDSHTLMNSTMQPTSVGPSAQPTSIEPTMKPTSMEPTTKPTSVEPTMKPTTFVDPTMKPSMKQTSMEPTMQPNNVEPTVMQPTTIATKEPKVQPITLGPTVHGKFLHQCTWSLHDRIF